MTKHHRRMLRSLLEAVRYELKEYGEISSHWMKWSVKDLESIGTPDDRSDGGANALEQAG